MDPLRNPRDPLIKAGPPSQQELFRRFTAAANGFSLEDVIGATLNMMVTSIRQGAPTLAVAHERYDYWMGRFKTILGQHYDSVTGKRRNIFPFDQVVQMDHFNDRDKVT